MLVPLPRRPSSPPRHFTELISVHPLVSRLCCWVLCSSLLWHGYLLNVRLPCNFGLCMSAGQSSSTSQFVSVHSLH